jgi:hypothetical membrane protein
VVTSSSRRSTRARWATDWKASAGALAGFGAIAIYIGFSLLAYVFYPIAYDPLHNPLSDLGNPQVNTSGALIYELGVLLMSVLVLVFSALLGVLSRGQNRTTVMLLRLGQAAGVVCGLSFILVGVFPLGPHPDAHNAWNNVLWLGIFFFEIFFAVAFLRMRGVPRWIPYLGLFAAFVDVLAGFVIGANFMEWATVAFVLAFMGAVAWLLWRTPISSLQPPTTGEPSDPATWSRVP